MGDFECCCLESIWHTIFDDQWPIAMTQLPLACMCVAYVCSMGVWQNARTVWEALRALLQDGVQTHVERVLVASTQRHIHTKVLCFCLNYQLALCQHCNVPASLETATMPYECVPSQIYSVHTTLLYVAGMKQWLLCAANNLNLYPRSQTLCPQLLLLAVLGTWESGHS